MTKQDFTSRKEIRAVIDKLCELGRDVIAITNYRSPRFVLGSGYAHAGSRAFHASAPGMSTHRRFALDTKLEKDCEDEYRELMSLFDKIPTWGPKLDFSFEFDQKHGHASVEIKHPHVSFTWFGDGEVEEALTSQIYAFIRINENLEMGPQLHKWMLAPGTKDFHGIIWADTPDNALLRFASASPLLRTDLRKGHLHSVILAHGSVPEHIKDAISKRVRKSVAPKQDWVFALEGTT